jgi:dolichol-phosphate mannosyltransferase
MAEISIIVPTFNERDSIQKVVEQLEEVLDYLSWEVVFVDDDSPDGTAAYARVLAKRDRRIRIIHRIGRRGLSSAFIEGALSTTTPFIAVMDADLQHDVSIIPEMLRRMRENDLDIVVASRYTEGGSTGEWSQHRLLISRIATKATRMLTKVSLTDPMSGFFIIRREAFYDSVRGLSQQGFKILLDLMASSPRQMKFQEVPYAFRAREHGDSKFDSMAVWQFGILVLDKLVGGFIPVRFVLFAIVGGTGVLLSLTLLWLFLLADMQFNLAQTVAVIITMTSNFLLNNAITYRDRRLHGLSLLRGLLSFYLVCGLGAFANVGVASLLYSDQHRWWVAGLAGALIGAVWNYVATRMFTWRQW